MQRELNRLVQAGLVRSEKIGDLRRFQANSASPVYGELVALTRKALGVEPTLKKALEPLASKLDSAFIYGSVAKRTDKAKSDVDVLLVARSLTLGKVPELVVPHRSATSAKDQSDVAYTG